MLTKLTNFTRKRLTGGNQRLEILQGWVTKTTMQLIRVHKRRNVCIKIIEATALGLATNLVPHLEILKDAMDRKESD